MKKLLILLFSILLLSSPSVFADDISDLNIEGISIGDSLLDYMTEEEILEEIEKNQNDYNWLKEPNKFAEVYLWRKDFPTYDVVSVYVKNDLADLQVGNTNEKYILPAIRESIQYLGNTNEKFKIHAIRGIIHFDDNIEECKKERNTISNVLSNIFKDAEKTEIDFNHSIDPSGNSKIYGIYFKLKSGDEVSVDCIDFEETLRINNNWAEGITVGIVTKEFDDWWI